ncbi:MAG TPA: efflux RND transporter periplasmic adaptor subunit [Planctomycetaceae bacterium]|jgi:multidrug efflux pump subunit AcrA (membrane-fusion protein)|nr:efflux RND transporter periplasmic adaptor subunit [Planctomycetaceae bacterium]
MKALVAILSLSTTVAAGSAVYLSTNRVKLAPSPQSAAAVPAVAKTDSPATLPHTSSERSELVGRLAPAAEFEVRASANSSVLRARVDPGDLVEKGQTLLELENPAIEETVRRAEMTLELAKSELENVQLRQASGDQRRPRMLGGPAGGGRFGHSGEPQARARVAEAEAALTRARQASGETRINAPISGYVAERRVSVGDRITPGMVVLQIMDVSTLKLTLDSPAADVAQALTPDTHAALITFDAMPNRQFTGRVIRSLGSDLSAGHSGDVSIEVPNPDRMLKPGMSAHVRLVGDPYGDSKLASTSGRLGASRYESRRSVETVSDAELVRGMLASMKGLAITLTVAADVQTKELTRKQEAAKVTVEATTKYFESLERELVELRPDNNLHHAVNLEKAADQIDNLPLLHVDEELLAFGAEVAQSLRAMAERRRSISRGQNSDVSVSDVAQVENSAIRTQGMQRIQIGVANMRRKMTKKYNLEFVALATNMRNTSASNKRRAAKH